MSARREFLKLLAAGPAAGILLPVLSETGPGTFAAEIEDVAELMGRLPENVVFSEQRQGKWKGKAGGHVPVVEAARKDDTLSVTVQTKHPMSEKHYIVRHTVVSESGQVLGAKTFSWEDKPMSNYEIKIGDVGKSERVFVTSFCNLHDLWLAHTKLEV